jgi:acyl-CoA thioesterase I
MDLHAEIYSTDSKGGQARVMRTYRLHTRLIQLSVFLSLLVVVAGFFGLWGERTSKQAVTQPQIQKEETPALDNTKIVAIGDSYTLGYPGKPEKSWPELLAKTLQIPVINKGKTYQTSLDLLSRFEADVINERPGRVIIFTGNGDALREVKLETFQKQVQAMVEKAQGNHIVPILALPLPYPDAQKEIKEFREWEISYAQQKKILVLDFASVLMNADKKYLEGFSGDGKYPTEKGYKAMADYAARVIK